MGLFNRLRLQNHRSLAHLIEEGEEVRLVGTATSALGTTVDIAVTDEAIYLDHRDTREHARKRLVDVVAVRLQQRSDGTVIYFDSPDGLAALPILALRGSSLGERIRDLAADVVVHERTHTGPAGSVDILARRTPRDLRVIWRTTDGNEPSPELTAWAKQEAAKVATLAQGTRDFMRRFPQGFGSEE